MTRPGLARGPVAGVLGYAPPPAAVSTLKTRPFVKVDGKFADAAPGHFGTDDDRPVVVVEGKGPLDPLDRPFAGRKSSAVDQALKYAM